MDNNLAYKGDAWQDPWREELIDGKLVAMAPARTAHNCVKGNVYSVFWNYLHGKECMVLPDGEAVYLTDTDYYYPDVMVVCDPEKIGEDGVYGAPDLVVEVLSPTSVRYDRGRKLRIYEESGVREYWIISPAEKTVEQYLLINGRYELACGLAVHTETERKRMKPEELAAIQTEFKCSLYDDLVIRLEDVFRRVP